jgi:hypothetical protein
MTVPDELKGAKGDRLAAHVLIPIIAVMIYGIYKFIELGTAPDHYLYNLCSAVRGHRSRGRSFHIPRHCIDAP